MELLIVVGYIVIPAAAVIASFALGGDADSPLGDGMVLGCLLLAVPLWPLTMSFWLCYLLKRHTDARRPPWVRGVACVGAATGRRRAATPVWQLAPRARPGAPLPQRRRRVGLRGEVRC